MPFSDFLPAGPISLRLEDKVEITLKHTTATNVWITCNGFCYPMYVDKTVVTGFKLKFYGWMPGMCSGKDLVAIADNGNILTKPIYMTVTEPQNPIKPICDFILNWLMSDPELKTYVKDAQLMKKPNKFITTRPAFIVFSPEGDIVPAQIGSTEKEYDELVDVVFADDIRHKIDLTRHERFIFKLTNYLSNNPTLSPTLGVVQVDPVRFQLPDERIDNIYLHQSLLRVRVQVIPEYTV